MQVWHVIAALGTVAAGAALFLSDDASASPNVLVAGTYGSLEWKVERNGATWKWSSDGGLSGGSNTLDEALVDVLGALGERESATVVRMKFADSLSVVVQQGDAAWSWSTYDGAKVVDEGKAISRAQALLGALAFVRGATPQLPWS